MMASEHTRRHPSRQGIHSSLANATFLAQYSVASNLSCTVKLNISRKEL